MAFSVVLTAITGLVDKVVEPITNLIDDERFTPEEKASMQNTIDRAQLDCDRARLEIEKTALEVEIANANADAKMAEATAAAMEAQTKEDDLFTKRLRPTVGYLMTLMLIADQINVMIQHADRYFSWPMLTGYFAIMGVYIGGRSIEKIKGKISK